MRLVEADIRWTIKFTRLAKGSLGSGHHWFQNSDNGHPVAINTVLSQAETLLK